MYFLLFGFQSFTVDSYGCFIADPPFRAEVPDAGAQEVAEEGHGVVQLHLFVVEGETE